MKRLYLLPTALLDGRQIGAHQAMPCPDPSVSLLVVEQWINDDVQDSFEAHPDVLALNPWDADKPAPQVLVDAFTGPVGKVALSLPTTISDVDTIGSAFWKLRAFGVRL